MAIKGITRKGARMDTNKESGRQDNGLTNNTMFIRYEVDLKEVSEYYKERGNMGMVKKIERYQQCIEVEKVWSMVKEMEHYLEETFPEGKVYLQHKTKEFFKERRLSEDEWIETVFAQLKKTGYETEANELKMVGVFSKEKMLTRLKRVVNNVEIELRTCVLHIEEQFKKDL